MNEIGAPFVESVIVCAAGVIGGAAKIKPVGLAVSVEGGAVTVSATVILTGDPIPVTVTATVAL